MRGGLIVMFPGFSTSFAIIKIQCFKSASQLCLQDMVYE